VSGPQTGDVVRIVKAVRGSIKAVEVGRLVTVRGTADDGERLVVDDGNPFDAEGANWTFVVSVPADAVELVGRPAPAPSPAWSAEVEAEAGGAPPTPHPAETAAALQREGIDRARAAAEDADINARLVQALDRECASLRARLAAAEERAAKAEGALDGLLQLLTRGGLRYVANLECRGCTGDHAGVTPGFVCAVCAARALRGSRP
jgi:hypothetical protein